MTTGIGYFIDAEARDVRRVNYDGAKGISELLGITSPFTTVRVSDGAFLYLDDEGMFKPCLDFFRFKGLGDVQPFCGHGLIVGLDDPADDSKSLPPDFPIHLVFPRIEWLTRAEADAWAARHAADPGLKINDEIISTMGDLWSQMPPPPSPILAKLPGAVAARHPTSNLPVIIGRGESGYVPQGKGFDPDAFNRERGITPAQVEAMTMGSMFGWDSPGADPDHHLNRR